MSTLALKKQQFISLRVSWQSSPSLGTDFDAAPPIQYKNTVK